MIFNVRLSGQVIDSKVSRKGRKYLKVYDGDNLLNIFVNDDSLYNVGDEITLDCLLISDDVFIKENDE